MKKFKCIFVHTPQLTLNQNGNVCSNINFSAMGLYSLANELNKEGFPTEIIHLGIEKYLDKKFLLSDYINQNDIKFVAFSLHWHPQSYDVIETARVVKERNPDIFLSIGGFTASYFAIEIMEKFPFVDAIIKGEGELPTVELAKEISSNKSLKTVPNLVWRESSKIITNKNTFVASNKDLDSYEFFKTDFMKNFESYSVEKDLWKNKPHLYYLLGGIGNCLYVIASYSLKTKRLIIKGANEHIPESGVLEQFVRYVEEKRQEE